MVYLYISTSKQNLHSSGTNEMTLNINITCAQIAAVVLSFAAIGTVSYAAPLHIRSTTDTAVIVKRQSESDVMVSYSEQELSTSLDASLTQLIDNTVSNLCIGGMLHACVCINKPAVFVAVYYGYIYRLI